VSPLARVKITTFHSSVRERSSFEVIAVGRAHPTLRSVEEITAAVASSSERIIHSVPAAPSLAIASGHPALASFVEPLFTTPVSLL
jgi:hypothetical protein